mmetsp:Transcript_21482/g.43948  ORF Transcript_21482/g.43948 Transcript_21482/m.43948 type:complete len:836 (-) Transcript_21482:43-2550(-)
MGNSSSASLPYKISPTPTTPASSPQSHGWAIYSATRKTDNGPVTAFQASKAELARTPLRKNPSLNQLIPALHHFHRIKRLIHPRILRAHATLDTDYPSSATGSDAPSASSSSAAPGLDALHQSATTGTLIIVTEEATPLDDWLDSLDPTSPAANSAAISWGLYDIVEALVFLHTQAKLAHGMICPRAIFVTPGGDFKLGGFDLITPIGIEDGGGGPTPHFRTYEAATCPDEYRSPERVGQRYDVLQQSAPIHSIDCYSLAVLIEYIYAHPNAGTNGKVPAPLQKALLRMKNESPKLRPRLGPLLKCPVFDNPYVMAQLFLDEVTAKPAEEKIMFLQSLPDILNRGVLSEDVAVHKILPLLILSINGVAGSESAMAQDVNRREILAIVPLLFQIAESFLTKKPELFQRHITPLVPILFGVKDRGVRGAVLQKISLLESQLDNASVNTHVFEPMCSGFSDSSAALRELTLKSTIVLVPKLHHANLEKLVRYLVRLQSDQEASIRTNTVIFIGKVAPNLSEISRQKLILPAFTRSMKDPFTPCRLSALRAVIACKEYFTQKEISEKVLPCIVPHLLDHASDVRNEAFKVVDALLIGLREESQRIGKDEAERITAASCGINQTGNAANNPLGSSGIAAAPASGSYLSGISSWMTSASQPTEDMTAPSSNPLPTSYNGMSTKAPAAKPGPAAPKFSSLTLSDAHIGGASKVHTSDDAGGWSDDDDILSSPTKNAGSGWDDDDRNFETSYSGGAQSTSKVNIDDDDDDFFASFDATKPRNVGGTKAATSGGSRLSAPKKGLGLASKGAPSMQSSGLKVKKQPVAVKKLPATDLMDDGWDDF